MDDAHKKLEAGLESIRIRRPFERLCLKLAAIQNGLQPRLDVKSPKLITYLGWKKSNLSNKIKNIIILTQNAVDSFFKLIFLSVNSSLLFTPY